MCILSSDRLRDSHDRQKSCCVVVPESDRILDLVFSLCVSGLY
jgi:hypothetical protein